MDKYIRRTSYILIDKTRTWDAGGCHTYTVYNQSNVNVTINNVLVLRPGMSMTGPDENPEVKDHSFLDFQFDEINNPKLVQPDTGARPEERNYDIVAGVPDRDKRVIIIQSFLTEA